MGYVPLALSLSKGRPPQADSTSSPRTDSSSNRQKQCCSATGGIWFIVPAHLLHIEGKGVLKNLPSPAGNSPLPYCGCCGTVPSWPVNGIPAILRDASDHSSIPHGFPAARRSLNWKCVSFRRPGRRTEKWRRRTGEYRQS